MLKRKTINQPPGLVEISHDTRAMLDAIKAAALKLPDLPVQQAAMVLASDGHIFYRLTCRDDLVAVCVAITTAKNYFSHPLKGGEKYLRHMLSCKFCLQVVRYYLGVLENPEQQQQLLANTVLYTEQTNLH